MYNYLTYVAPSIVYLAHHHLPNPTSPHSFLVLSVRPGPFAYPSYSASSCDFQDRSEDVTNAYTPPNCTLYLAISIFLLPLRRRGWPTTYPRIAPLAPAPLSQTLLRVLPL